MQYTLALTDMQILTSNRCWCWFSNVKSFHWKPQGCPGSYTVLCRDWPWQLGKASILGELGPVHQERYDFDLTVPFPWQVKELQAVEEKCRLYVAATKLDLLDGQKKRQVWRSIFLEINRSRAFTFFRSTITTQQTFAMPTMPNCLRPQASRTMALRNCSPPLLKIMWQMWRRTQAFWCSRRKTRSVGQVGARRKRRKLAVLQDSIEFEKCWNL